MSDSKAQEKRLEISDDGIVVDAEVLGELLNVPAASVPGMMRRRSITSVCEHGTDVHEGEYRLTFFFRGRRAQLRIDTSGNILQRLQLHTAPRRLKAPSR